MGQHENCRIGYQSLAFFAASLVLFVGVYLTEVYLTPSVWRSNYWSPILYFSVVNIFLRLYLSGFLYDAAVRSTFLGFAFATGAYLSCFGDALRPFGMYACLMAFFHFSEFFATAVTNPSVLRVDSFLLNHSPQYAAATLFCVAEWALETYLFPETKRFFFVSIVGLIICICGEFIRKAAMFTAKTNFNHIVQYVKSKDHILVTHGIYSVFRHPSYVGWFYWAIGTQILLLNPISFIAFTMASWIYFRERIYLEEYTLLNFFDDSYVEYQKSVSTGLPFIKGYVL